MFAVILYGNGPAPYNDDWNLYADISHKDISQKQDLKI